MKGILAQAKTKAEKRPPDDQTVLVKIGTKWKERPHDDLTVGGEQFHATRGVVEKMQAREKVEEALAPIEDPTEALQVAEELAQVDTANNAQDEIDAYIKRLLKPRIKRLIFKAVELAEGILVEKKTPAGKKIYSTPPNERMLNYLLDQYFGRSKPRKEGMGNESNEVKITLRKLG